ncbi:AlpA family phage regulatory protein [Gammaproteobacteria bacterium]|nr:AlpA family phage regulatory protein [Gammaproteobacteria bacterium]
MLTTSSKNQVSPDTLLSLPEVLSVIGVAPSTWWAGVASGKFPRPVKCGRRSFWPQSDIADFIESLKQTGDAQ